MRLVMHVTRRHNHRYSNDSGRAIRMKGRLKANMPIALAMPSASVAGTLAKASAMGSQREVVAGAVKRGVRWLDSMRCY